MSSISSNNHANFHCPCRGRSIGRLCPGPGPYLPIRGKPVLFFPARNDPLSYVLDVISRQQYIGWDRDRFSLLTQQFDISRLKMEKYLRYSIITSLMFAVGKLLKYFNNHSSLNVKSCLIDSHIRYNYSFLNRMWPVYAQTTLQLEQGYSWVQSAQIPTSQVDATGIARGSKT